MSVITFWSDGKHQTEQTISMASVATQIAITHNYKILLINTRKNDKTLEDSFWDPSKKTKIRINTTKTDVGSGTSGLVKAVASHKISPEIITNYTRIVLKGRLEVLTNKEDINDEEYMRQREYIKEIIKTANKYYDLVFVDIGGNLENEQIQEIINMSDLVMVSITQKLRAILDYMDERESMDISKEKRVLLIGRYDKYSKYNLKNLISYTKEKELFDIPYSTVFYESCYSGKLVDFFYNFGNTSKSNPNTEIVEAVKKISDRVVEKLKEIRLKNF